MKSAVADGIFTDHLRDGACEELVTEGWLMRIAAATRRGNRGVSPTYLPTDLAAQDLHIPDQESIEVESEPAQTA
jgi:hypothetical protein